MTQELTRFEALLEDPSLLTTELDDALTHYEFDNGLTAEQVSGLTTTGITFWTHYKAGEGRTPYSDSPEPVRNLMSSDAYSYGEGIIEFPDHDDLQLPKHLYFDEEVSFEGEIESVEDLEDELERILGVEIDL